MAHIQNLFCTEHVLALVEAVHRAHFDAVHGFAANATLVDDVGQLTVLSAGRSGELVELQQVSPPRYTQVLANYRSTDARHSEQWSARSGGRRASRFALPRRASYLNPPTRRMGREES
jgi:hypothetical protein